MGWLSRWLEDDRKTFDQDLELLVARWTNRTRRNGEPMETKEVSNALRAKANQLDREPQATPTEAKDEDW